MTSVFADEETEAPKGKDTWPRSPRQQRTKLGFKPTPIWHQNLVMVLNSPCLEHRPSGFKRVEGPFWRYKWAPMPSPAPKWGDPYPGKVYPTREGGRALNPEPLPHTQSMPQAPWELASQAPTRLHHFLPGRLLQGKDV